jgi:Fe-S-cluster containining protein
MKQFLTRDFCLKCLGCCRFAKPAGSWLPALSDKEIKILLKKEPAAAISADKRLKTLPLPEKGVFICQFLNPQDNKCAVYAYRPLECQLYPFLINRSAKKVYLAIDENCPFVKGKSRDADFKEYIGYLSRLLNTSVFRKLLKDNPQLIQSYRGVVNVAEIKL